MSERKIAGVPLAFVKGGTTSTEWDREKKKQYDESDARRAHQDRQRAAVQWASQNQQEQGALMSMQLDGPTNPKIVLTYAAKDHALEQECLSQLVVSPNPDNQEELGMVLVVVCPKCLERTGRQDDSQVMVKSWHREFWLDETKSGIWVNQLDGMAHQIAGTVTAKDKMACTALGCDWQFRIDDSKLYGSHFFSL